MGLRCSTWRAVAIFIGLGAGAYAPAADTAGAIVWIGTMTAGNDVRICLRDQQTELFRWVAIGESLRGYTFASFDATNESAVLRKNGLEIRVVRISPVRHSAPDVDANPSDGELRLLLTRGMAGELRPFHLAVPIKSNTGR